MRSLVIVGVPHTKANKYVSRAKTKKYIACGERAGEDITQDQCTQSTLNNTFSRPFETLTPRFFPLVLTCAFVGQCVGDLLHNIHAGRPTTPIIPMFFHLSFQRRDEVHGYGIRTSYVSRSQIGSVHNKRRGSKNMETPLNLFSQAIVVFGATTTTFVRVRGGRPAGSLPRRPPTAALITPTSGV